MKLVTERLTSLAYGGAAGASMVHLVGGEPLLIGAVLMIFAIGTEIYRGFRFSVDE